MAWVETRITRTTQPQDACGIDWNNPLARGLLAVVTGALTKNLATNKPLVPHYNILPTISTPRGRATEFAHDAAVTTETLKNIGTGDYTDFWFGVPTVAVNAVDVQRFFLGSDNNQTGISQYGGGSATVDALNLWDSTWLRSSKVAVVGEYITTLNTRNSGSQSFWVNGKKEATQSSSTNIGAQKLVFGAFIPDNFWLSNNRLLISGRFDRSLSDFEIKSLSENPWQIFEPEVSRIWVDDYVSAGGGATDASGGSAGLTLSPISATGSGAATASATIDSAALSPISATASAAAQVTAAVADLTTSATNATANGQALAAGSAADLTTSPVAATAFTTAVGTALASPANVALAGAAGAAQGAASATATVDAVSLAAAAAIATNTADAQAVAAFAALLINPATGAAYGSAQATGSLPVMAAAPLGAMATGGAVTATKARPAADISNTGWTASTGADLFAMLNEEAPDAASYIQATTVGASALVDLGAVGYPGSAAQRLSFSGSSSTGNGIRVSLINKANAAVVRTVDQALTPTDTRYDVTLTAGEIAAITSGLLAVQLTSI